MAAYETVTEAINALRSEGYTTDFNLMENHIRYGDNAISHDEFIVDKFFRFEGDTDPADEAIVYAISCPAHHLKGILVNGYGIYTETLTNEMAEKLRM